MQKDKSESMSATASSIWTRKLLMSCLICTFSASFMFGYGIGGPNQYTKFTEPFLSGTNATKSANTFVTELKNGIGQTLFVIGNFVGAMSTPFWFKISRFFDRKRIFYANHPLSVVYAAMIMASQYANNRALFYVARFINGFQGGMANAIVPPYLNEISPQALRGTTGSLHQLFITIGILVAQVIGIPILFGREQVWSIGLAIGAIPSIVALFLTPTFMSDSPVQMVQVFADDERAKKALKELRVDEEEALKEFDNIKQQQTNEQKQENLSFLQIAKRRSLRWPLITALTLMAVQALSGINAVFFYSTKMFTVAGIKDTWLPYSTVCTGLINVIVTILVVKVIDRFGRRPLLIYPMASMIFIFIALIIFVEMNARNSSAFIAWLAVGAIILFIMAFAIGLGPIPFIYTCEVFRSEAKDAVLSASLCVNYFCNILLCLFFPAINTLLKGYVFAIFAVIVSISLVVLVKKMPETRNKTIEEIEAAFAGSQLRAIEP